MFSFDPVQWAGSTSAARDEMAEAGTVGDERPLDWIGRAPAFEEAERLVRRISTYDATALVEGETGTGKELAARAIHYLGARREHPFIPVNCGALPDTLLESELFGHERGAFTDAKDRRTGLVAEARGGTLFLDEVEAMSPRAQVVLLRFLQDQKYRPVGGRSLSSADVRVVAASNADLSQLSDAGIFRRDLFFRLSVLRVRLPPLRERIEDVLPLVQAFVERFSKLYDIPAKPLHPECVPWLMTHDWPGNVRELESMTLCEFLLGEASTLWLGPRRSASGVRRMSTPETFRAAKARAVASFERSFLNEVLSQSKGNLTLAAKLCEKDRSALSRLVRKHALDLADFLDGESQESSGS